jgi:cysteine-rich repeat protein
MVCSVLTLLVFLQISSALNVGGTISVDTTWTLPNSPYVLTSPVIVAQGVTLTVQAGVAVRLESFNIFVEGSMTLAGSSSSRSSIATGLAVCGDGVRAQSEGCDDDNLSNFDGCSSLCAVELGWNCTGGSLSTRDTCLAICGDNRRVGPEQCDSVSTGCLSNCTCDNTIGYYNAFSTVCTTRCGDGLRVGNEGCDDGNLISGDGCAGSCFVESGWTCSGGSSRTRDTCTSACGDGIRTGVEECDATVLPSVSCSIDCRCNRTAGFSPAPGNTPTCQALCGDGRRFSTEQCDDGNLVSGDGCNFNCFVETGWTCTGGNTTNRDTCRTTCGDSMRAGLEECDGVPQAIATTGCFTNCTCDRGGGWTAQSSFNRFCAPVCGDRKIVGSEVCDDGNVRGGDGCSSTCQVEFGWSCTADQVNGGSSCRTVCGDGIRAGAEECDVRNDAVNCLSNCTCNRNNGYGPSFSFSTVCSALCGDGKRVGSENCDDGNTISGDGCSSGCFVESGYICTGGSSTSRDTCRTTCGDGVRAGAEGCDDGNFQNGDGCSSTCTVEVGRS